LEGGGRGRNRTYNLSVKRGIVKPGKLMISKEYGEAKRTIWSLFGGQFGEEFGEVLLLRTNSGRTAFSAPAPTASGNLVVDRTVVGMAMNFRSSEHLSSHGVEVVNWRLSGFGFGEKFGENGRLN
jgi:hypothetical protein